MKRFIIICFLTTFISYANAQDDSIYSLTIEELMNMKVVSATRYTQQINQAPATIMVVTKEMIKNRGYKNIADVLRDLPGMDMQRLNGWYGTVFAQRGMLGDENKKTIIMINDVVENQIWGGEIFTSEFVSMQNIERIEIIWGPASALYGANAFCGIIHIITTAENEKNGTSVSANYGTFNTFREEFSSKHKINNNFSAGISGTLFNSAGPVFKTIHPKYSNSYSWNTYNLNIHLKFKKTSLNVFNRHLSYGIGNSQAPVYEYMYNVEGISVPVELRSIGAKNSYPAEIYGEKGTNADMQNTTISLKHNCININDIKLNINTYFRVNELLPTHYDYVYNVRTRQNIINPAITDTSYFDKIYSWHKSMEGGTEIRGVLTKKNFITTLGVQLNIAETQIDYTKKAYTTFNKSLELLYNAEPVVRKMFVNTGIYLQVIAVTGKYFSITAGSRFDINNQYGKVLSPRIGLISFPTNELTLKLMAGTAFRAPTAREMYSTGVGFVRIPNPLLKPEKLESIETNVIYNYRKILQSELSLFYNYASELIFANIPIENSKFQNQNMGKMNIYGSELKVNCFIYKKLNIWGSISYQNGESTIFTKKTDLIYDPAITDTTTQKQYVIDISNIARWKGLVGINYNIFNKVNFNVRVNYVGKRTTVITNPLRSVGGYTLVDIYTVADISKLLSISAGVENLLNAKNFDPGVRAADNINYVSKIEQVGINFNIKLTLNL